MGAARAAARRLPRLVLLAAAALALPSPAAAQPTGPSVTSAPFVLGVDAAGNRLSAFSGTWTGMGAIAYRFQWFRCDATGAQCSSIRGATSSTYRLGARDVGKTLALSVYATDSTGVAAAKASLVGPVAPARPLLVSTTQPSLAGIPAVGQTLHADRGRWSPVPQRLSYAWERCNAAGRACAPIPGATGSSYLVVAADLGHALVCLVQASNGPALQDAFSVSSAAVVSATVHGPAALSPPQITGAAVASGQLIAATGRWQSTGALAFTFQWYRCNASGSDCAPVRGATAAAYRLGPLDAGQTIGLTLHARDLTGTSVAYASLVGPVPSASAALTATAAPTISDAPEPGGALTVSQGSWSTAPSAYSYSWLLCDADGRACNAIPDATGATYTPTSTDSGHTLVAEVEATVAGTTQAALSAAFAPPG